MANAMNLVNITVVGRLLANPVSREYEGKPVTNFRMRVNQTINMKDQHIDFEVSCWNSLAGIGKILKKGRLVAVTSNSFIQNIWTSQDNSKQGINNQLMANSVVVMDSAPETVGQQMPTEPKYQDIRDEEIPF